MYSLIATSYKLDEFHGYIFIWRASKLAHIDLETAIINVSKGLGLEIMEYILTEHPPLSLTKERSTSLETKRLVSF